MKSAVSKVIIVIMLLSTASVTAQEPASSLRSGIDLFRNSNFSDALRSFRDVILDPSVEEQHADAYYWIARCYLAMEDLDNAEKALEFYLLNYPDHSRYPEAYYQKGRLLYLQQEYEKSIRVLYDFIDSYPENPFLSNGYFWIGENLFSLGALEDAKRVFSLIPEKYPSSFKVEAARYRISLIDLKEREEVLLDMIQMSHEEYIKVLEDFQMRERTYKQALDIYQNKLADAATADKDGIISSLRSSLSESESEVESLKKEVLELETKITSLENQLEQSKSDLTDARDAIESAEDTETVPEPVSVASKIKGTEVEQLLELKSRLLDVKQYYLNWLTSELEAD